MNFGRRIRVLFLILICVYFKISSRAISLSLLVEQCGSFIKCIISGDLQQQATNSYRRRFKQPILMEGEATQARNGLASCFSSDAHNIS